MRRIETVLIVLLLVAATLLGPVSAAGAQSASELDEIADALASDGRYLEFSADDDLDRAIADANGRGVAFAWLDSDSDAEGLASELSNRLSSSTYRTVLVLTNNSTGAWSPTVADASIEQGLDASLGSFAAGAVADGVESFTAALDGQTTATTTGDGTSSTASEPSSGGGIGFGSILLLGLIGGGGFLLFRNLRGRSKARKASTEELEADRAEIKEQLRDNADHVLKLGDRVIEAKRPELISTYEEASATYQDVSQSVDGATTAEEIDRLDDRIDRAEWQFESIEAELEGRPAPPSPEEVEAQAAEAARDTDAAGTGFPKPPTSSDRPALGADESVFGDRRRVPQQRTSYPRTTRRSSGGLGGGLGGILGSILLGGGGLGGMSRRTQRRTTRSGGAFGSGGFGGGGLGGGGGVLRRGGSRSRGSGGGRSLGRGGSGGGRRF